MDNLRPDAQERPLTQVRLQVMHGEEKAQTVLCVLHWWFSKTEDYEIGR